MTGWLREPGGLVNERAHHVFRDRAKRIVTAEAERDPLWLVDQIPRPDAGMSSVALQHGSDHPIEQKSSRGRIGQSSAAASQLDTIHQSAPMTPSELEEHEQDAQAVARRDRQRFVQVEKHPVVEAARPAVAIEPDACPTVTEHEPPDDRDAESRHLLELVPHAVGDRRRRQPAGRPPAIGAKVEAVVDPWKIDTKGERRPETGPLHLPSVEPGWPSCRRSCWAANGHASIAVT